MCQNEFYVANHGKEIMYRIFWKIIVCHLIIGEFLSKVDGKDIELKFFLKKSYVGIFIKLLSL